ncbi:MAG: acylphosphatase [Candidatus Limnocylindrales bacterium]
MTRVRLDATVRGVVQGVGFRVFVLDAAAGLAVSGWVANERAGALRCVAEGDRADLEALVRILERGPAGSIVESVSTVWMPTTGTFDDFSIRSTWHSGD